MGQVQAGGVAAPGAQGEDAAAEGHWSLVDDGKAGRVEELGAPSGPEHEKAVRCGRGGLGVG